MAIRHQATLLCELALRDAGSGLFTVVNVFQNLRMPSMPGAKARLGIVVWLAGQPGEEYRIVLNTPSGEEPLTNGDVDPVECEHEFQQTSTTVAMEARPMVFRTEGVYEVLLLSGDEVVNRHPFGVFVARGDADA